MNSSEEQNLPALIAPESAAELPTILAGHETPAIAEQVRKFYFAVADIFEAWVRRRSSAHTQRAYRADVMSFVQFMECDFGNYLAHFLAR